MPTTTNMGLPYPAASAAPDVPGDLFALALKLDKLGQAWTPSIDGVANTTETQGWWMRVGGYVVAHAFFRTADSNYPASNTNYFNLPLACSQLAGVPYAVGTVDIQKRAGGTFSGKVMMSSGYGSTSKGLIFLDTAPSGGGPVTNVLPTGSTLAVGSTDALYFNARLLYWVGV